MFPADRAATALFTLAAPTPAGIMFIAARATALESARSFLRLVSII
jgi:hypothetical protein